VICKLLTDLQLALATKNIEFQSEKPMATDIGAVIYQNGLCVKATISVYQNQPFQERSDKS
jgi:hypothetical protein